MSTAATAIEAIDEINSHDPFTVEQNGHDRPKELVHSEAMTKWLTTLDPNADVAQQIAARAHHLRRWAFPRTDFPAGRTGYLSWRTNAREQHAAEVDELLGSLGYDQRIRVDVVNIISKTHIGQDPRAQTHEDALCLVFFELQGTETAAKLGTKGPRVVVKTLAKMSAQAHEYLLATDIELSLRAAIESALAGSAVSDGQ